MKRTTAPWTRRLLTVTALLSLLCLNGCLTASTPALPKPAPPVESVRVIPADKIVLRMPNGNYEVTPAWIQERYRLESWLAEENKRLRGK